MDRAQALYEEASSHGESRQEAADWMVSPPASSLGVAAGGSRLDGEPSSLLPSCPWPGRAPGCAAGAAGDVRRGARMEALFFGKIMRSLGASVGAATSHVSWGGDLPSNTC